MEQTQEFFFSFVPWSRDAFSFFCFQLLHSVQILVEIEVCTNSESESFLN
jgi:hypothetical protein